MGRAEDLSDFQLGTVIGCHLSKKSVQEISALLELPRSTVSNVLVNWKRLFATTASPQKKKSQKSTQQDRQLLVRVVNGSRRSPVARTTESQTASGSTVRPRAVRQRRGVSLQSQSASKNKPKNKRKTKPVIKLPSPKQNTPNEDAVDEKPE